MLPYQQQVDYDNSFPVFRLTDGDTVRQGRLQALFRDRWRSVCTMVTNWTSIDMSTACRSMGYSDGGFYKWYLRNNDTYPFVLPRPGCHSAVKSLWDCPGLKDPNSIRLSENLCQGEDDLGIICWGQPTFRGWARHWKGIEIFNSPYKYVSADPDQVAVHKESLSRLEFVDILYAGYDASTKNTTAALWIEGVAPIMNGILVERSARDGLYIYEPCGPVMIANSTFSWNRGHGIVVDNTTDGRVFINMTRIENNYGDGIWYRQKIGSNLLNDGISIEHNLGVLAQETPRADICIQHSLPPQLFFPHLLKAHIHNGTLYSSVNPPPCWIVSSCDIEYYFAISLPSHLAYTYSVQFVHVRNMNPSGSSSTYLVICDATKEKNGCGLERLRIPIVNRIYPQTVSLK
ncbi:scavenger receptor cysteine-rich domain protein [Dictyocaulus viviparus]|uniref:Scavenger receptor cysteine-rich domain protein n=1 Tax=Dictyocaulus viviparus TaxID=29172 RepID=A0A0D8XTY8_DICVI|nr:scavenger receptor cysteine-rich domain protein [Dictyocaulus viviparus]